MQNNGETYEKPVVVVSKCMGFDACRWDGTQLSDPFVEMLKPFVEFVPVCPEYEIGLGVPRRPIRIIAGNKGEREKVRLVQPALEKDVTEKMTTFCDKFLGNFENVDGFFLKYKSPSCGPSNVSIYHRIDKGDVDRKAKGFFAQAIADKYPNMPCEDEGRLHNFEIRESWLTALFTLARFRRIKKEKKIASLVRFHSEHKYLFMSLNQTALKAMGKIVANHEGLSKDEVFSVYHEKLFEILKKLPGLETV